MITIVDYGLGNVGAFANVYKRMNVPVRLARSAEVLADAERIILPGVGSFDHAMDLLEASGMRDTLDELVTTRRTPVLGVCVGMQILGSSSDEGSAAGLGWIPGHVRHFGRLHGNEPRPLPHMGWNDVRPVADQPLFVGLETDSRFYFLHSFYFECGEVGDVAATSEYGPGFASSVRRGNVYGAQFHPEKSHHWGARLLKNFAEL
ncbi:MAG: imidazole glycerol phosphate synthase subunit HisH [Caulobacteraceae bacterium]|nr:imidazole glycerol phosphate synthase subunit HisH [Caulobacteraceae bacterium]